MTSPVHSNAKNVAIIQNMNLSNAAAMRNWKPSVTARSALSHIKMVVRTNTNDFSLKFCNFSTVTIVDIGSNQKYKCNVGEHLSVFFGLKGLGYIQIREVQLMFWVGSRTKP